MINKVRFANNLPKLEIETKQFVSFIIKRVIVCEVQSYFLISQQEIKK